MRTIAITALLLPLLAQAQLNKCTDSAGKVTFTERACENTAKSAAVNIPLSTEQTTEQRRLASQESRDRAASDRREAISLMLQSGRVGDARAMARTADERAMVAEYTAAQRQQQKEAQNAESTRRAQEAHDKLIKKLRR